ncbi:MAG: DNA polymerase I [Actinomycetota bacterium]
MSERRLLLIDGHSMAYRAFFALPVENFTTTTGQPTNAVFGFTSMVINMLKDVAPTHVAVAFDVSRKSFRTERFPDYKGTRSATPPEFKGQVELIDQVLDALGIATYRAEGYEADDIIATLTSQAVGEGFTVEIITGDRDSFQLVTDHVTVLYPRKGVSDLARMTPESIHEKYGLTPPQYPDFAALRGDPSDNLPGIAGVGEKTAVKWLTTYGSLAELVDHADEIGGKVGESLRASIGQVLLNRELTELLTDVPLPSGPESCAWTGWNPAPVDEVFSALQFTALRDRVAKLPRAGQESVPTVQTPAVDIDVTHLSGKDFVHGCGNGVAIVPTSDLARAAAHRDGVSIVTNDRHAVVEVLSSSAITKTIHEAKACARVLLDSGSQLRSLGFDTALAAYLAMPGQRSYALPDVEQRVLGRVRGELGGEGQLDLLGGGDADDQVLGADAAAVADLESSLRPRLAEDGLLALLVDVEQPVALVLAEMEHTGIYVDRAGLETLSREFGDAMRTCESAAEKIVGRPFNMGSPKQLQEILFGERGLPKTKKSKTGYTTDAEALQGLFEQTEDPLLAEILAWRDRSKLRQTVDGLIPLIAPDGRIHTTFHQTVAATGRLSSSDPNLQNIPVRTDAGRSIRRCFVVGEGFESLMTADYSQIQLRIMAHVSEDAGLITAFQSGEDLHTTVASAVFGVPPADVDAEMRRRIKAMSYGLAYGLSPFGLSQQLRITSAEAQQLMDEYFQRFGGIRNYLAGVVDTARASGYTETMFGRRRYLPDLQHDNRQRREMAERMALNAPIQGTAADIVKIAMLGVAEALTSANLTSRLLLQVHDELVVEVAPGEAAEVEGILRERMGAAASLRVPLEVTVGVGTTWDEAAH